MRVYADNAATTYLSDVALNTLLDCLKNYNGNPNSLHTDGQIAKEKLDESREKVAKALNAAKPNEIYFTSGGSEADNQALISAARGLVKKGKKHLISLNIEHHAILHTLRKLEKEGFEVTLLKPQPNGIVDVRMLRTQSERIRHSYRLCLLTTRWELSSQLLRLESCVTKRACSSTQMPFRLQHTYL